MNIIERLYDEIHGPKLTPFDLLENVKLPHYLSVDFKSKGDLIIGTTKCSIDNEIATFTYIFKDDKLISLKSSFNEEEEEIYNREKAIKEYYVLTKKAIYSDTAVV